MARTHRRLTLTCTDCGHPFHLTARAYAQRRARYADDHALCQRCIGARWLRAAGRGHAERLLQEDQARPVSGGTAVASRGDA